MEQRDTNPTCPTCDAVAIRWGKDSAGHQRYRCQGCRKTFANRPARLLGSHRIPEERGLMVLSLLVEGMTIRGIERVTGTHRDTICRLLRFAGDRCAEAMERLIQNVEVKDVQADEIWGFVKMKQKTKNRKGINDAHLGDSWCWSAIERESKLVLTHHVGGRTIQDADVFTEKLAAATTGDFQYTTDGLEAYTEATSYHLGERVAYAQLIKEYASASKEEQRRYSPASIIGTEKRAIFGNVEEDRICTSHTERLNLTTRTAVRRMTRLTCGFSKKWENHRAALALHFASYNFCKFHRSLRMPPAMKAGITQKPWGMRELLAA